MTKLVKKSKVNFLLKFILSFFGILLALLLVCLLRAVLIFPTPKLPQLCEQQSDHQPITLNTGLVDRFRQALTFKTISWSPGNYEKDELVKFREFLRNTFPTLHSSPLVNLHIIANHSLLYEIKGSDLKLRPYMLCSHQDVVPVEQEKWKVDPFSGVVDEGFIYGRGAIDVKDALMGIMEAVEFELKRGFKPKRTIYLAFGHDEEIAGLEGATAIRDWLLSKGIELEYLLDEGTVIMNNAVPGVASEKIAVIGVAEKGYLTVRLEVKTETGHASTVPYETSIVILAKALSKFNSRAHLNMFGTGPEKDFFESLASYASLPFKMLYGNLWLFGPLFSYGISMQPLGNAMVRTTSAVTVIKGGMKDNVIPSLAYALINHRIHPSQTIDDIIDFDKKLVDDERVEISVITATESAQSSPHGDDVFGFQTVKRSIQQVFPDAIVVPGMMLASTDTKWYKPLTKNIYRFTPAILSPDNMTLFHGHNERISVENYVKVVNFYHHVILASDETEIFKKKVNDEL